MQIPKVELVGTLRARELLGGRTTQWIWQKLRDDATFPRPFRFTPNGARLWPLRELEEWIEAHREDVEPKPRPPMRRTR